ncbi:MAG: ABC transporter permease [Kiritimatiellaeota bacterium]|nr:ABC transporter permease [Kiritimatiellota bacterium]
MWDAVQHDPDAGAAKRLAGAAADAMTEVGRGALMVFDGFCAAPGTLFRRRARAAWFAQMHTAGIGSLGVISVVALFIGMILALQIGIELRAFNQEALIGPSVMVTMLREMGPMMTGVVLAACVGSAMAAQIGMMTVNEEVAALELMSISPVRFLATPRLMAMLVMAPLLSFYTCVLGVFGGALVGVTQFNVPLAQYFIEAMDIASNKSLYVGLLKAAVFGVIITGVSCYEGFSAAGGAVGVGEATRKSVIKSILLILVTGYVVTRFFY